MGWLMLRIATTQCKIETMILLLLLYFFLYRLPGIRLFEQTDRIAFLFHIFALKRQKNQPLGQEEKKRKKRGRKKKDPPTAVQVVLPEAR